jgi:hypothetical protein
VLPSSGDIDVKERLKIIPWIENVKTVGLPSWLEGYNGKPALITKSGSITRGDDYIEITMNLFRFGFLTRKGMHHLLPGLGGFELHCALTIEGREDDELDERCFIACKARNLDLIGLAAPVRCKAFEVPCLYMYGSRSSGCLPQCRLRGKSAAHRDHFKRWKLAKQNRLASALSSEGPCQLNVLSSAKCTQFS